MTNDPQVPWTDEQWARVNQVIQEEASRARVAATFLPLHGPLPADTDFVRAETINFGPPLTVLDRNTIQLATLHVMVSVRGAQMSDPEMTSVLAMFRRAANVLARLEDTVVFRGLIQTPAGLTPPDRFPRAAPVLAPPAPQIWQIAGGQVSDGLLAPVGSLYQEVLPPAGGQEMAEAVSGAIGQLEGEGHFGPFAVVLDQKLFLVVQTPGVGLVLPQDRIIPFLGGGPLLRSSTLPDNSGVVVALGGRPVELVVATDVCLQFLQVTLDPVFRFRVREKLALRIKEAHAIATLALSTPAVWAISPNFGPIAGGTLVNIRGINLRGATAVSFGPNPANRVNLPQPNVSNTLITNVPSPASAAGSVDVRVNIGAAVQSPTSPADLFTYQ